MKLTETLLEILKPSEKIVEDGNIGSKIKSVDDIFEHIKLFDKTKNGNPILDVLLNVLIPNDSKNPYEGEISRVRLFIEMKYGKWGWTFHNIEDILVSRSIDQNGMEIIKTMFGTGMEVSGVLTSIYYSLIGVFGEKNEIMQLKNKAESEIIRLCEEKRMKDNEEKEQRQRDMEP